MTLLSHLDIGCTLDDVEVGHDVPSLVEYETRALWWPKDMNKDMTKGHEQYNGNQDGFD